MQSKPAAGRMDVAAAGDGFPPQIKYIIGNEACERFSFYGVRGILTLYIAKRLGQGSAVATEVVHLFIFGVYFLPLFGAWLSDRVLGRYRTILYLSLFYCLGHLVLALSELTRSVDAKLGLLYTGLILLSFGSGGIKPCVSAFVGDQFASEQDHLLQKAYGLFYWSINFGSFFAFLFIPRIRDAHGYGWAFGVPGLFMGLALVIFWLGTRHYKHVPPAGESPKKLLNILPVAVAAILFMALEHRGTPGWLLASGLGLVILAAASWMVRVQRSLGRSGVTGLSGGFYQVLLFGLANRDRRGDRGVLGAARDRFDAESVDGAEAVLRVLGVLVLIPFFWALWDQNSTTWVIQGDRMKPFELTGWAGTAFGWLAGARIGAEQMQSLNPLIVMALVPLYTYCLFPWTERLGIRVTMLRRMSVGLFLAAGSFVLVALIERRLNAGHAMSVLWQTWPYVVLTAGEVLVSTTGLEFAFREAPQAMRSTLMSFWLLTVAVGNLVVARLARLNVRGTRADGTADLVLGGEAQFWMYALLLAVVGVLFIAVAMRYRYRDPKETSPAR